MKTTRKQPNEHIKEWGEDERCLKEPYPVVGTIAAPKNPGEILVAFDSGQPVPARLLSNIDRKELTEKESIGRKVLCVFEKGRKELPIIIGRLENPLEDILSMEIAPQENLTDKPIDLIADDERIVFEAKKEIVLKCGKGSITIKKDGKIVILGTNLISRSRGQNKIKGTSVSIN